MVASYLAKDANILVNRANKELTNYTLANSHYCLTIILSPWYMQTLGILGKLLSVDIAKVTSRNHLYNEDKSSKCGHPAARELCWPIPSYLG